MTRNLKGNSLNFKTQNKTQKLRINKIIVQPSLCFLLFKLSYIYLYKEIYLYPSIFNQ